MKTVFVVDDNNVSLNLAQKALSKDYRVFTLPSASAMFALLENVTPDLILLDIMMPEMDGFTAMTLLKNNEQYTKIPFIFFTSKNDSATKAQAFETGAVDYIHKPVSETVLLNRIKIHFDTDWFICMRTEMLPQRKEKPQRMKNIMPAD